MAYESITSPGQLGKLEIPNRITLSPMEKNWCDRLGNPGQNYIDYYALRAKHGVGSMNFEATYIDPRGRGNLFQLGLWSDDNIPAHKRLVDAVKAHGARTAAELNHGGRNSNTHRTGLQPLGPSNHPLDMVGGHELYAPSQDEIEEIIGRYRDGARRAAEAGYDMITIHGAHGYLVSNFLSYVYNTRTDGYGGSDENRWRFATEIYQAMREEVGNDMPIGIRVSAQEEIEGGYKVDFAIRLANHLAALGLDYVDVSTGLYESIETLIQPMDVPQGCLLPLARQFKEEVSIPVIGAGRINDIDLAEQAISSGDCDFVHMGRAFHADPEILSKSLAGRRDEVVGCIACNKCCMQLFVNLPSVCTVNLDAGRERQSGLKTAETSRRVMVVGGGMAGMEAATIAARRGHEVTLYERTDALGGIVNIMKAPADRQGWGRAIRDRERMMREAGVRVEMRTTVTTDIIRTERPDVLIVATGAKPFIPKYLPGWDEAIVTDYETLIRENTEVGDSVVVIGGQMLGVSAAEFLAERGASVVVLEATGAIAQDLEFMAQKLLNGRLEKSNQITVRLNTNAERIGEDAVGIQSQGIHETLENIDQVVFAIEREMDRSLLDEITDDLVEDLGVEYHAVGDCVWPQDPYEAMLDGNRVGRMV
ncbi:MAG: NAD(P)/FAD-dependent oxidoreductase [Pseudomonadota bacterium]